MTEQKLEQILKQTNFPLAEDCFEKPQKLPYIAYLKPSSQNFFADNRVYQKGNRWRVELYTRKKDRDPEKLLESILDAHDICYEKERNIYQEERYCQTVYEFEEMEI